MKISDLKEGDYILLDNGFTCAAPGVVEVFADERGDLFFDCEHGKHYLDGQIGPDGELIGVSRA